MKKIIAFAGSNSKKSINKQLVKYASRILENTKADVVDINQYEMPLYGVDYEAEFGIPEQANEFQELIKSSDGIILSLAEHNGAYTVAFKNLFDWMSRINQEVWSNKPMLLMATTPGARGGITLLELASGRFPYMGGNITDVYSLPSFHENFSDGKIVNSTLDNKLKVAVKNFESQL